MRIFTIIRFVYLTLFISEDFYVMSDNDSSPIVGLWIPSSTGFYIRSTEFQSDKSGYEFKSNGEFILRGNVGWCGTPPITYRNYVGKWKLTNENALFFESSTWSGPFTQNLKYQFLDEEKNQVKFESYKN